jgi:hydrophobic/amphiphilic exporter-1 (mainly G- bacteria), HAE1 family
MNFSEMFIRRPVMTIALTVSVILFGVVAYFGLPVSDLPSIDYPVIQVSVDYPGATPETMANNVATPLERQFMQIPGLELVTSSNSQGHSSFTLQFDLSKSLDGAATDVQAAITRAKGQLPTDLPSDPTFTKTNPNDQPILFLGVTSDTATEGQLYDYGNTQIGQRISILPGVSQVAVYGSKSAIRIKADPSAMAVRNLTLEDLTKAIKNGTSYSGAGQFDGSHRTLLLQPQGQLSTVEQYNQLIVTPSNVAPVYLKDVATTSQSVQNERTAVHFWSRSFPQPGAFVAVAVYRRAGANAVEVAESVRKLLPAIQSQLPSSVAVFPVYDRSRTIVSSISDVKETLYLAFVLVVMVVFVFLGRTKDTMIPAIALPLSLLLTFVAMHVLGYSLDNLSLMALTLAIGFLVDDAIVFLENTVRLMEEGRTALDASLESAKEISFTIVAMTVSLAAVFIPLVFMSGLMGRIFREFSITIVVSILASGLVSLTLTPLMTSRMLDNRGEGSKKTWMERAFGAVERRVLNGYGRSLWFFLRHRWISAAAWVLCLAGTGYLFYIVPKSFLPIGDSSFIRGVMVTQEGSSPEQLKAYQAQADQIIRANPAVSTSFTISGASGVGTSNQVMLFAFLKDPSQRPPITVVSGQLMGAISGSIPGVLTFLQPNPVLEISTGATSKTTGRYAYALSGINPNEVYDAAAKMMGKMYQYPGFLFVTSDLYNHTPNLQIDILREQAKLYGVSEARILTLLHDAYSENFSYLIKEPQDQYQVILQVADNQRSAAEDLGLLYIKSDDGSRMVPLNAITKSHVAIGSQSVNHINQFTSVTINFDLKPGFAIGGATQFIEQTAKQVLPAGVEGALQGEALIFQKTVRDLLILMVVAVFVMYVILAILYESYLHPLTVLSSLPVALLGGLLTLWLFGAEASLYAYIGMFMLMGIVKKNGIMIVDFAEQRVRQGIADDQAIHDASMQRFRPIMMTTMAALLGALPIALGFGADGASRRPLGMVVVGGLIVSQLITLYVTPAIYLYLEEFQEKVLDRVPFLRSSRELKPSPSSTLSPVIGD